MLQILNFKILHASLKKTWVCFVALFKPMNSVLNAPVTEFMEQRLPVLLKDKEGRERCVSCQLCEIVCPVKAINILPEPIMRASLASGEARRAKSFEIDMDTCVHCGICAEVCPEGAIELREEIDALKLGVFNKDRLYQGGKNSHS